MNNNKLIYLNLIHVQIGLKLVGYKCQSWGVRVKNSRTRVIKLRKMLFSDAKNCLFNINYGIIQSLK
jgi:hypothetical protein